MFERLGAPARDGHRPDEPCVQRLVERLIIGDAPYPGLERRRNVSVFGRRDEAIRSTRGCQALLADRIEAGSAALTVSETCTGWLGRDVQRGPRAPDGLPRSGGPTTSELTIVAASENRARNSSRSEVETSALSR